ncbi:acetoacetate decarboxylase family protein [Aeromicrobium choanae]|uniref:acetoacetate decarboxylase family protein n=1 Tax=Aeromicrobium choanae TaxID=1736691 RepID=UPI001560FF0E|nr:acetoacetate decarboxylase family protein [Aeromicrobium choanae]
MSSPEELDTIQQLLDRPVYTGESVSVGFRTKESFVREVLPPCFELADEPLGSVSMSHQASDREIFTCTTVRLAARFGDITGAYNLMMTFSGDMPITIGREKWGEPKKRGETEFGFVGETFRGSCTRYGREIVRIEADFTEQVAGVPQEATSLELKASMATNGLALQEDPRVVAVWGAHRNVHSQWTGTASVDLLGGENDPLETIPIVSWGDATYTYSDLALTRCEEFTLDTPDRSVYLPYLIGRSYDFPSGDHLGDFRQIAV